MLATVSIVLILKFAVVGFQDLQLIIFVVSQTVYIRVQVWPMDLLNSTGSGTHCLQCRTSAPY